MRSNSYIDFLAQIRPLIDQGLVWVVSAYRMSENVAYYDTGVMPDEDLVRRLEKTFFGKDEQIFVASIVKYICSLSQYRCSAFYERPEQIKIHDEILPRTTCKTEPDR